MYLSEYRELLKTDSGLYSSLTDRARKCDRLRDTAQENVRCEVLDTCHYCKVVPVLNKYHAMQTYLLKHDAM
jgi:hypothetical protein